MVCSVQRGRVRPQQLEERRDPAELVERRGDRRVVAVTDEVDEEEVLPAPVRAGRDSKRDIDTPCSANGARSW